MLNPSYPAVREGIDVAALGLQSSSRRAGTHRERTGDPRRSPAPPARLPRTLGSGLIDIGDLAALGRWMAPAMVAPGKSVSSSDESLATALDRVGADGNLRTVLDRFLVGVLVDSYGTTSANFTRLLIRSFATGRPGLPRAGMEALPAQIAEGLPDVRLGHWVERVRPGGAGISVATDHGRSPHRWSSSPPTDRRLLD